MTACRLVVYTTEQGTNVLAQDYITYWQPSYASAPSLPTPCPHPQSYISNGA